MKELVISKRMETVAGLVPKGVETVADVGCDHAYVSIKLVKDGIADKVIAMDLRKGPLKIAANNIRQYGMDKFIETRLSDGLDKLMPSEADAIIIAGMGGLLMKDILERGIRILNSQKPPVLILQPQSDIREIRRFLFGNSYHIERESMVYEEGKYYTAILAACGSDESLYDEAELLYGRYNIVNKDKVLISYLEKEENNISDILKRLEGVNEQFDPANEDDLQENAAGHSSSGTRKEQRIEELRELLKVNRIAYKRCVTGGEV